MSRATHGLEIRGLRSRQLGRSRDGVETPALLLDLAAVQRNILLMAAELATLDGRLRPHAKTHKSVDIARMQVEAGAVGLTCATLPELMAMADAGLPALFLANQVVDPLKASSLAELARRVELTVAVDTADGIDVLSAATKAAHTQLPVVIEVDIGMGRSGARTIDEVQRLAEAIERTPSLRLVGVHGYEGHCAMIDDRVEREEAARTASRRLAEAADSLQKRGFETSVVTSGGTVTFRIAASTPGITDVQAGSYVLMDSFHERLLPSTFELACTVCATVVSRHGSTVVADVGRKSIAADLGQPALLGRPDARLTALAEEHAVLDFDSSPPAVGERIEFVPAYAPTTVALHPVFVVHHEGLVVDMWPITPRHYPVDGDHAERLPRRR